MELNAEIKGALDAHGAALEKAIEKFDGQLKDTGTVATEAKAEVKALSEKFESTVTELVQKMDKAGENTVVAMSAGQEFIKSAGFDLLKQGKADKVRVEVKNTVLSDATTVFADQRPGIIPGSFLPLTIRQIIPSINVTGNAVNSLKENAWTNSAAEVSQGTAKPESDLTFTNYDVAIRTVAHWIKVSKQLLDDAPAVASYIDIRLRDGLAQRIDAQLLNGDGTSPNLSGLTDSGNYTAFTADSSATLIDSINKCKYVMWAGGNMADTVIVNPADWGAMERARESAGSGQYLYGTPGSMAGVNPFGLQVVLSNNMTAGYFVMAAMRNSAMVYARQGATIEMGYVNTDFTANLVTIRAEERLGLGVDRPAGIYYGDFSL
jgi:HK97 family phage major capsid protein